MNGIYMLYLDQYGNTFYASTLKELKEQVSGKVSKMYSEHEAGKVCHVGYVIGQHWLTAFVAYRKEV